MKSAGAAKPPLERKITQAIIKYLKGRGALLRQVAPVRTQYTSSNHDMMAAYYATDFLSAWYRQDHDVQIDTGCSPRKYVQYGINLLGLGHGDKEGKEKPSRERASRLASMMPIEARSSGVRPGTGNSMPPTCTWSR